MGDKIRVLVADDHPLFREGVVQSLQLEPAIAVVGEAANGMQAVALAAELRPDVVLLDVSMPGGGIDAATQIARLDDAPKVVMLTVSEQDDDVMRALDAGVLGYVLKGVSARELITVVMNVASGESYVSPKLSLRILAGARRKVEPDLFAALSGQEARIVALVAKGLSNREIAAHLDIKEKTVKFHMTRIMGKLNVRNRVEVALASRQQATS